MRFPVKTTLLVAVGAAALASYPHVKAYWHERNRPRFQEEEVTRDRIVYTVNSTGTVQPVLTVHVGSFASGPVLKLYANFNDSVKKDQLLAKIDPWLYKSNVERDEAALLTRVADVDRVKALLQQAVNDENRARALRADNRDYVSDTEMDQFRFNRKSLEAQLKLADAAVKQAQASLDNSKANLAYTDIRSPVDGIIIDRKIDEGQTLAAQFQTPEMFIIAPNMREEMHIYASVDEADIGLIRKAQEKKQPVHFTVDAYPDDLFAGRIREIRMSATTTQNVVTYPVIVSTPNSDLKLLPGMTANLSFQVEEASEALRVPNAALRFYPKPEHVRPEDRPILEGLAPKAPASEGVSEPLPSAEDKVASSRKRNRRHVWVLDGELLRAVAVETGVSDDKFTAIAGGGLAVGQKVVTGVAAKTP